MELLLDWKSLGSLLATFIFIRTAIHNFLPPELHQALKHLFFKLFSSIQPTRVSIIIEEFDHSYTNEIYDSVQTYISSKCFSSFSQILKLSRPKSSKNLSYTIQPDQTIEDTFNGFKLNWSFHIIEKKSHEHRYFSLSFHHKFKEQVRTSYIPHVIQVAETIKFKNRERKLYTNRSGDENGRLWSSVPFMHPSTFDTVAMDPALKQEIQEDLMKFVNKGEFFSRVGRAWKRGYLLYGPPGTGKTTLIAAIANFLKFDIYDLELTAVRSNSQLRKLLISTSNKSVIIVEDIDCSIDLSNRKKEKEDQEDQENWKRATVSLSGVLNFVDGLWSSCGGERLMIFTTNHKEKLDEALLRSGRMDKHISLSYCKIEGFTILMRNYLSIEKHELMEEVEELLPLVKMTPADIGEIFMGCEEDAEMGMTNVVAEMKKRVSERLKQESAINGEMKIGEGDKSCRD